MLFQRKKIVVATTRADVDTVFSARGTADEVIVEGDEALLSYAERRADGRPPELRQEVSSTPKRRSVIAGIFLCSLLALAGISYAVFEFSSGGRGPSAIPTRPPAHSTPRPPSEPPEKVEPEQTPPQPEPSAREAPVDRPPLSDRPARSPPPAQYSDFNIQLPIASLAWAVVVIVAIVALAIIAWKAIAHGQNVDLQWKVTDKVTGRLVITKVEVKRRTRREAA